MAAAAGDIVWIVLAHLGMGEVVGGYTTLALAQAAVGAKPGCGYRIFRIVVDTEGGMVPQAGSTNVGPTGTATPVSPIPPRAGIKSGTSHP